MSNKFNIAYIFLFLTVTFWAGNFIVGKFASFYDVPPFSLNFYRWFFAWLILAPFTLSEIIKKRDYIVSEHAGRGSSDLLLNNLYFTLTKKEEKVFMILEDKKLFASAYFDLDNDPYETRNLIMNSNYKDKIKNLIDLVVEERKEIILKRGCEVIYP